MSNKIAYIMKNKSVYSKNAKWNIMAQSFSLFFIFVFLDFFGGNVGFSIKCK